MTVFIPHASRRGALKASAPAENDIIRPPPNSAESFAAKLTVTAWRARPDRYIIFSFFGKTSRRFSTSSVLESLTPNCTLRFFATACRRLSIGTASAYLRSCSNARSGTTVSA